MNFFLPDPATLKDNFARHNFVIASTALLPDQANELRRKAIRMSRLARPISRHEAGFHLVYQVVTGEQIQRRWSDLLSLYTNEGLRAWIKAITGASEIVVSPHLESGVNLNVMKGDGDVYRWHFDAVPYTALLYLTDVYPRDGGALELAPNCVAEMAE